MAQIVNQNQAQRVSPAQRAEMFSHMTRKHLQVDAPVSGVADGRISFVLPQSRLLASTMLMVEATLTATHATLTTYTPGAFAPYSLIRQLRIETNNGFTPVRLSGRSIYFESLLSHQASVFVPTMVGNARDIAVQGVVSSAGGAANRVRFCVDLENVLNDRDPVGLILLQNKETVVTVTVDFDTIASIAPPAAGFTFALSAITVTPMVKTYSIPAVAEAFPDLSILKLVQEQVQTIPGAGVQTVKLPTGTTYRKLAFFLTDAAGAGIPDFNIPGDLELVLNQADTPYRIRPSQLSALNTVHYGMTLPVGLFVFDMSAFMGLPNFSGARDYIDTERLTEFWLRFNAPSAGSVTVIYEILSQLR